MSDRYYYAELKNDVCIGVSEVQSELEGENLVPLTSFDVSLTGKKYNRETGEWSDAVIPAIEAELTEQEMIQAEILLNQATILAKQNEHDKLLAEILAKYNAEV